MHKLMPLIHKDCEVVKTSRWAGAVAAESDRQSRVARLRRVKHASSVSLRCSAQGER